jgi:hypothetical protein
MRILTTVVCALILLVVHFTLSVPPASAHDEASSTEKDSAQVYEGALLDRDSFQAGKGELLSNELKNKSAVSTIFGLARTRKDGSRLFFQFDANGQNQVPDVLKNYPAGESVKVTVVGEISGNLIKVLTVTEKLDEKDFVGVLIDRKNFEAAKSDPAAVGRENLQATEKIASGFGVAVKQPNGEFSFLKLDDNSQISASEIIAASKKERGITVIAIGTWNGSLLQATSVVEKTE